MEKLFINFKILPTDWIGVGARKLSSFITFLIWGGNYVLSHVRNGKGQGYPSNDLIAISFSFKNSLTLSDISWLANYLGLK